MTLSTLVIKKRKRLYLGFSIFCLLFSFIYECFSHGVYSYYLIAPGFILLIFGYLLAPIFDKFLSGMSLYFYNSFLACILVGLYIKGILDIYGTTNELLNYYGIFSIFFAVLTFLSIILNRIKKN